MYPSSVPYREGKNIVIYDARLMAKQPIPSYYPEKRKKIISPFVTSFIKGASSMCILLSAVGVLLSISPIFYAEIASNLKKKEYTSQTTAYAKNEPIDTNLFTEQAKIIWLAKKGLPGNVNWDFTLLIPKIGLNSKVFPNIDPSNKDEYMSILKSGVAHAKFTALPGQEGLVYIFGHSTDYPWNIKEYNALFYDIKDLKEGDEIIILYNNKPYVYKTLYQKIVGSNNLVYLNSQTNAKMLVLQTCYPPGTTWKRLVVVASLVENNTP